MTARTNIYLERIQSACGAADVYQGVASFIGRYKGAGDTLTNIASRLGVNRILLERLPFDGGVFQNSLGDFDIKLNVLSSPARRRFTLAHEIAHVLLRQVPGLRSPRKHCPALERACDVLAAELLMPVNDFVPFVREMGSPSPEKLVRAASRFDVSLQAAAVRVQCDLRLWRCSIGLWDGRNPCRPRWLVGKRAWRTLRLNDDAVREVAARGKCVSKIDWFGAGGLRHPLRLHLEDIGSQRILGLVSAGL